MLNVLLVDDCKDVGLLVQNGLDHHAVHQVETIAEARAALERGGFSLMLIDVNLPDGNGFEFCMNLSHQDRFKDLPKIMLTSKGDTSELVYGFSCGADDYVTKPFHQLELRARVDRFLQKKGAPGGPVTIACFEFNVEFQTCQLTVGLEKQDLGLTPTEFRLFYNLAKNSGRVLTRKALEKAAWESFGTVIETRGIDTHIAHLRKKLGPHRTAIISVYGQGYSFQPPLVAANAA